MKNISRGFFGFVLLATLFWINPESSFAREIHVKSSKILPKCTSIKDKLVINNRFKLKKPLTRVRCAIELRGDALFNIPNGKSLILSHGGRFIINSDSGAYLRIGGVLYTRNRFVSNTNAHPLFKVIDSRPGARPVHFVGKRFTASPEDFGAVLNASDTPTPIDSGLAIQYAINAFDERFGGILKTLTSAGTDDGRYFLVNKRSLYVIGKNNLTLDFQNNIIHADENGGRIVITGDGAWDSSGNPQTNQVLSIFQTAAEKWAHAIRKVNLVRVRFGRPASSSEEYSKNSFDGAIVYWCDGCVFKDLSRVGIRAGSAFKFTVVRNGLMDNLRVQDSLAGYRMNPETKKYSFTGTMAIMLILNENSIVQNSWVGNGTFTHAFQIKGGKHNRILNSSVSDLKCVYFDPILLKRLPCPTNELGVFVSPQPSEEPLVQTGFYVRGDNPYFLSQSSELGDNEETYPYDNGSFLEADIRRASTDSVVSNCTVVDAPGASAVAVVDAIDTLIETIYGDNVKRGAQIVRKGNETNFDYGVKLKYFAFTSVLSQGISVSTQLSYPTPLIEIGDGVVKGNNSIQCIINPNNLISSLGKVEFLNCADS